jgi:cytidylate kinase
MKINIAIDGPSAAGKSTIAKKLAEKLGYVHLDTGAMYRCTALKAVRSGIALDDEASVCAMLEDTDIRLLSTGEVFMDGEDVSQAIRTDENSLAASAVSKLPKVREDLVRRKQKMAEEKGYIMDGRDIGTVVFPNAELKVFVTASAQVRAQRRYDELKQKGMPADFDDILKNVEERDYIDSHREVSPLRQADDALLLDNSDMTIAQQKQWLLERFQEATRG